MSLQPWLMFLWTTCVCCLLSLYLSLYLSISLFLSLSLSLLWIIGNLCIKSQNYLSLFFSFSPKSSPLIALNANLWKFLSFILGYIIKYRLIYRQNKKIYHPLNWYFFLFNKIFSNSEFFCEINQITCLNNQHNKIVYV